MTANIGGHAGSGLVYTGPTTVWSSSKWGPEPRAMIADLHFGPSPLGPEAESRGLAELALGSDARRGNCSKT